MSIATLVATGRMTPADAIVPILAGLTANTLTKLVLAASSGGRAFAARVVPGLILVVAEAWASALAIGTVGCGG